jgi:hypothetical protein
MDRAAVEAEIRAAYAGVTLGAGISLRQTVALDAADDEPSPAELDALRRDEEVDDWTRVPEEDLTAGAVAYLDGEGLRYYLPALLVWLLDRYDDTDRRARDEDVEMTVIGTIGSLAPSDLFADELYEVYDGFTPTQRRAVAAYVDALPTLVHLRETDADRLSQAVEEYWGQFLPPTG